MIPPTSSSLPHSPHFFFFFSFNDTPTTEIYTLSLHDALPISGRGGARLPAQHLLVHHELAVVLAHRAGAWMEARVRSEEHTSELQSPVHLVCRLLREKKKRRQTPLHTCAAHNAD